MTADIRMAIFDNLRTENFGITDIRPRDIDDDVKVRATGYSSIELTIDWGEDGIERAPGGGGISKRLKYFIYDLVAVDPANVEAYRVLAENIRAFGLAFRND